MDNLFGLKRWMWFLAFLPFITFGQEKQSKFKNLGPQIFTSLIQGSVFADDQNGKSYVYTVVRGRPAHLVGFEIASYKKIVDVELEGTDGSWDLITGNDGIVYIAGANGHLFKHTPGTFTVEDLGIALPGEKVIWDLTAGAGNTIYGGTYPGCRVFSYNPDKGFSDVANKPLVDTENYTRSLVYDKREKKLYAGIATKAALIKLDPVTGQTQQLLPDTSRQQEAIYHINIINNLPGGDRVFGWLTGAKQRVTVVYNTNTQRFEDVLPSLDVKSLIKSPHQATVYYSSAGRLFALDYTKRVRKPKELCAISGEVKASSWSKDGLLYLITASEKVHVYNPKTNALATHSLAIPKQAIDIQSIGFGPDGNVWSAGYLAGGHATYNPTTGEVTQKPGLDQTEGMGNLGPFIYFGIYAKSRLYKYDTRKAWDVKNGNPEFIAQISGQDRPFAVLGLEKSNQVIFGTVPTYGHVGGALVQYDVESKKVATFENLIQDQSIISLVKSGDLVIGGTSIFGGLGGVPTQEEAVIFAWDPIRKVKVFEISPGKNIMSVTGLINGPDGNIWGFADGDFFILDVNARKIIVRKRLFAINSRPSHIWRSAFMQVHPNGKVYVAVNGKLYSINPETIEFELVEEKVSLLTMDNNGTLYFRRNANLWSFNP
ncbi:ligand-binding sensor domain-containing protein [Pelobium manganitolerans]|nr:hypothetical protein [Pelobium manganitolerans]